MDFISPGMASFIVDAVAFGIVCWILGACIPQTAKKTPDQVREDEHLLRQIKQRLPKEKPKSSLFGNNRK